MNVNAVARIASLIGEPTRTTMMLRLMDGRALTSRELASAAGITAATASRHLAMLVEGGLLDVTALGRHRYHRIASAEVAMLLESIMQFSGANAAPAARRTGPRDEVMRRARTCYDHLAGRLGVAIAQRLAQERAILIEPEAVRITNRASESLGKLGVELAALPGAAQRRPRALCRPCMDWSERRFHLGGRLGAAICSGCMARGWLSRKPGSRALDITPAGQIGLRDWLGLELWQPVAA